MALAALEVLGLTDRVADVLDPTRFVPAVGQGCVAVECRHGDAVTVARVGHDRHAATRRAVTIERAFLDELGAGCTMPVGAYVDGDTAARVPGGRRRRSRCVSEAVSLSGESSTTIVALSRATAAPTPTIPSPPDERASDAAADGPAGRDDPRRTGRARSIAAEAGADVVHVPLIEIVDAARRRCGDRGRAATQLDRRRLGGRHLATRGGTRRRCRWHGVPTSGSPPSAPARRPSWRGWRGGRSTSCPARRRRPICWRRCRSKAAVRSSSWPRPTAPRRRWPTACRRSATRCAPSSPTAPCCERRSAGGASRCARRRRRGVRQRIGGAGMGRRDRQRRRRRPWS